MAKDKISQYSTTNALNTDIGGIDIDENCLPSNLNDAIREVMVQLREFQNGASGDPFITASITATVASISGGTINGTSIGATTPSTGNFTALSENGSPVVVQTDIGTAPNEIPLNQYLGNLAYQDADSIAGNVQAGSINNTPIGASTPSTVASTNLSYTGTLTGSTGVINIGSGQVYKDASGNVGIGTSSPSTKLEVVVGSAVGGDTLRVNGVPTDGNAYIEIRGDSNRRKALVFNSNEIQRAAIEIGDSDNSDETSLYLSAHSNDGGTNPHVAITSSGNVGIGTSSPSFPLTIVKTIADQSSFWSDSTPTLTSNFGNVWSNYQTATSTHVAAIKLNSASTSTGYLTFHTNGANERMRIDSSGNLLVGTTSQLASTRQTIVSNSNGVAVQVANSAVGSYMTNTSGTGNWQPFSFNNNGTSFSQIGSITCTASATSYNTSSDYRLKEDTQPVLNPIDRLMQLKPINFAWKVDGTRVDGFLAHEAQTVVPDAVTGEKDAVDKDGNPEYQGIDQSKLVPLLTAALQELNAKVEALEAQLNSGV